MGIDHSDIQQAFDRLVNLHNAAPLMLETLQFLVDYGLLVGPTELEDRARATVHEAIRQAIRP